MHHTRIASRLLAGTATILAGGFAGTAFAQDSEPSYGVSEIIVTAQKREQSIQDVPLAVTALGQDSIEANKITDATNLTGLAPGLVARPTAGGLGSLSFAMRGVNANPSAPLQDKQISMYVDGVYFGGSRGTVSELMEVERIEVLRGPQGTLFGRNSTAGAVNIVTRDPTGEMAFRQDITIGNEDHLRTRTTIDTPSFGPFSAYATYIHDESRGDVRNLGAGVVWDRTNPFIDVKKQTSPKWLGGRNYENVFAALKYDGGGDVTATYKFDWSKGHFAADARVTPMINTMGERVTVGTDPVTGLPIKQTFQSVPNVLGSLLMGLINAQPAGGGIYGPVSLNPNDRRPDAANQAWATNGFQEVQGHNLTVEWQASDSITVKNILAYRENEVFSGGASVAGLSGLEFNQAGIPAYATFVALSSVPGFATMPPAQQAAIIGGISQQLAPAAAAKLYFAPYEGQSYGKHWQVSDELQVNYSSDKMNVTAGMLYYEAKTTDSGLPGFAPNIAFQPIPTLVPLGNHQHAIGKTKSYAAYAQVEYQFTDQLGIVAGGRWTKDDKYGLYEDQGAFVGTRTDGEIIFGRSIDGTFKKDKFTYAIGVNYEPNDDMLFYGKYATGFLSGGIYADIPFPAETAESFEAGMKLDLLDRRVRFNLAAYKVDYKNAQATTSGRAINREDLPIAVISNGKLKAKGVELDLNIAPFEGVSLGGTVGYTKNSYSDPDPALADGYEADLKPTGQPRWVGSAFAQYITPPVFDDATVLIRSDMTFQSKSRVLGSDQMVEDFPQFAPYKFIPSKQIVNARVALQDVDIGGANVEVALWSKNLFDNKKALYPFQYPYFLMTTSYEPARTYGLDLIVKFNP